MCKIKCVKCNENFPENEVHESHDIPRYIFDGDKKQKKNQADKYGRHYLCKKCHDIYEKTIFAIMVQSLPIKERSFMITKGKEFSKKYFKRGGLNGDTKRRD